MVNEKTKFYVLKGAGNRGKSTVLFYLTNEFVADGAYILENPYNQTVSSNNQICDYCLLIQYKNKNIIIMSKGDDEEELNKQWGNFKGIDRNIDIIIGASRTRGQTVDWWKNFKEIEFFDNGEYMKTSMEQQQYSMSQLQKFKQKIQI